MESEYIQATVGPILAQAMSATIDVNPSDPVDYLAKWLLHYRDVQDEIASFHQNEIPLIEQKKEYLAKMEAELARLKEEKRIREEEEAKRKEEERLKAEEEARRRRLEEEEEEEERPVVESTEASNEDSEYTYDDSTA